MGAIKRALELGVNWIDTAAVIDLYRIHWPNPDEEIEEGWSAMAELKEEGTVRYIGVSNS